MELPRSFGIVLHPTSLPGRWGIGTLGAEARRSLDWLAAAGARWWQVLPLGPTGYGDSPYQSFSAFAGNPYLIDPEELLAHGWLRPQAFPPYPADHVDFGRIYESRWPLLRQAYAGFLAHGSRQHKRELNRFARTERAWLPDYALFMALKAHFTGAPWNTWPRELGRRDPRPIAAARRALADEVEFYSWTQWCFDSAWKNLRSHARDRGISIIGDMPIFVAYDSTDVWAHPEYFFLDDNGTPTVVAGVPPDYFSATGQRWGNPLYRWDVLADDGFEWWIARVRQALRTCDLVRVDHFRGFEAYWEIPATEPTAVRGRWVKSPGNELLQALEAALGQVPILAEDLGVITPKVEALRDRFGFPGMRVLQFAFGSGEENPHLPHNYPQHGRVLVYTGTHDNDTTLGWYQSAPPAEREHARAYLARNGIPLDRDDEAPWAFIRLAFNSRAALAMVPLQDVLGLDGRARLNHPGRPEGNWAWRCRGSELTETLAARLRVLAVETGRVAVSGSVQ